MNTDAWGMPGYQAGEGKEQTDAVVLQAANRVERSERARTVGRVGAEVILWGPVASVPSWLLGDLSYGRKRVGEVGRLLWDKDQMEGEM